VLEPIEPAAGSFDPRAMARGEPGVPRAFRWRGRDYEVVEVLGSAREVVGAGGAGGVDGVGYVRRHAVTVRTRCGLVLVLVGARARGAGPARWSLREIVGG
jgi:hypothetical protein